MGRTFPHICSFWRIMHEVVITYYGTETRPLGLHVSISFAEFKFRELLAWSNNLPSALKQDENNPHHVLILQSVIHSITPHLSVAHGASAGSLDLLTRLVQHLAPRCSSRHLPAICERPVAKEQAPQNFH